MYPSHPVLMILFSQAKGFEIPPHCVLQASCFGCPWPLLFMNLINILLLEIDSNHYYIVNLTLVALSVLVGLFQWPQKSPGTIICSSFVTFSSWLLLAWSPNLMMYVYIFFLCPYPCFLAESIKQTCKPLLIWVKNIQFNCIANFLPALTTKGPRTLQL